MSPAFSNLSLNFIEIGHLAAYLALATALLQGLAPIAARVTGSPALARMSLACAPVTFALTTLGGASLIHAFITNNFSVQYVATNSNSVLPLFYKITALWGGHEGSLYLWVWVLTFYTVLVAWHGRKRYADRLPVILAAQGWVIAGFFGLILFLSNPFLRVLPAPPEGRDLNPLLQDPGMAVHPPMLYLGYVGFSVPFAFAMAALITRWPAEQWIVHIRRWTLIAWGFLTLGIVLGAHWAYYELGWGGYWAWDPVENASFMPWLVGTALVHSITVQERRRMLHTWNIFLVISAFSLSLLGTFLVRSGVLSSVHAFAVDPGRGAYILAFMTAVLVISFGIFLVRGRYQEVEERITSTLSRESLFVWNNVAFVVAAGCVLLGTLYPLALEALTGAKITVGPPYFNTVMIPLFLVIALLMGLTPLVPWRKANAPKLRRRLVIPALLGLGVAAALEIAYWPLHWTGPAGAGLVAFVLAAVAIDLLRAIRQRRIQWPREGWWRAGFNTLRGNRRHYGGMLVHVGVAVVGVGLIGSGLFRADESLLMRPGDTATLASEHLRFEDVRMVQGPNYKALQARFLLNGRTLLTPERRRYPEQEAPTTEASIHSTPLRDVYVVLGDPLPDGRFPVHLYVNPLVVYIWTGGLIMLLGLFTTLSFTVRRAARARASAPAAGGLTEGALRAPESE